MYLADSEKPLLSNVSGDKQRMLGALLAALRQNEIMSDQLIPAEIVEFDRVNNIATVQPLIQWVDVNDGLHDRTPLIGLNVFSLGGGGFHISFPLVKGNLGWIAASDRDISLFKQSLAMSAPNTGRLHKFEDGWFIPDVFRQYTLNSNNANAMLIESTDGTTAISISEGIVKIIAPTSVLVDSPTSTFTGNVIIQQNLTVTKNAEVQQNLTVDVGATLPAGSTVGGINVSTHGHTSSAPGVRTAAGMIA